MIIGSITTVRYCFTSLHFGEDFRLAAARGFSQDDIGARYIRGRKSDPILVLWLMLLAQGHYRFVAVGHLVPTLVAVRVTTTGGRRSATALVRCHPGCVSG